MPLFAKKGEAMVDYSRLPQHIAIIMDGNVSTFERPLDRHELLFLLLAQLVKLLANLIRQVLEVPQHIAIIMDGNGRWAKSRGLPRTAGHAVGAETFRTIWRYPPRSWYPDFSSPPHILRPRPWLPARSRPGALAAYQGRSRRFGGV